MIDPSNGTPVVILKDVNSEMLLPIWVGTYEANAIALEIEKTSAPRPMTHDLLRNCLLAFGARLQRVVITELRESTFYAVSQIEDADGRAMFLDTRPSDAIALAMRFDCPIYVDEEVMRTARTTGMVTEADDENDVLEGEEEWPDVIGEAGDLTM